MTTFLMDNHQIQLLIFIIVKTNFQNLGGNTIMLRDVILPSVNNSEAGAKATNLREI